MHKIVLHSSDLLKHVSGMVSQICEQYWLPKIIRMYTHNECKNK
jgi:hypothetical protein